MSLACKDNGVTVAGFMGEQRDKLINLRATSEEVAMLHALAERDGISASDLLRQFIRRSYAAVFGEKRPKPKK